MPKTQQRGKAARARTRVLVVDDHKTVAEAISLAVDLQDDLESVGVAATVEEAADLVVKHDPDVVLMDLRLPDADGVEGTRRVKSLRPRARVLILTAHGDLEVMARAASAGASGFLPKTSSVAQILDAIRTAKVGGMLVEPSTLTGLVQHLRGSKEPKRAGVKATQLTAREHDVLMLMGNGLDPRAIAKRLGIGLSTCRGHVQAVLSKLEVHSQLEAVVAAVRRGVIPPPEVEA